MKLERRLFGLIKLFLIENFGQSKMFVIKFKERNIDCTSLSSESLSIRYGSITRAIFITMKASASEEVLSMLRLNKIIDV